MTMPATMPSTRLGDASGHAIRFAAYTFDYVVPVSIIALYRMIPENRRGRMFGGPSASTNAMRALLATRSGGWGILRAAASNHPTRPPLP